VLKLLGSELAGNLASGDFYRWIWQHAHLGAIGPAIMKKAKTSRKLSIRPWSKAEILQLGRVRDSILARRLGRTIKDVVAERRRQRIGLSVERGRWTAREVKFLGKWPDREVASRFRRTKDAVRQQRMALKIALFGHDQNSSCGR